MLACPYCEEELRYTDYFGRICAHQDGKVLGDIFRCWNEKCEAEGTFFHSYRDDGELHEGYPC